MQTKRFASKLVQRCYPLPCLESILWQPSPEGYYTCIDLPPLLSDQVLIPCISIPFEQAVFRACLSNGKMPSNTNNAQDTWQLQTGKADSQSVNSNPSVSTHVDYFHIHKELGQPVLRLDLNVKKAPENYLIVLAITSKLTDATDDHTSSTKNSLDIPPRSQMQAPALIRDRICSPTCVGMVLDHYGLLDDAIHLVKDCYDNTNDMYGVWPVNIGAASRRGCLAAVECFSQYAEVCALLDQGIPLICSIQFTKNSLSHAPLKETTGHLVVLTAVNSDHVQVYDPAAKTHTAVSRHYSRSEFFDAWINNMGVAYVLVPFM